MLLPQLLPLPFLQVKLPLPAPLPPLLLTLPFASEARRLLRLCGLLPRPAALGAVPRLGGRLGAQRYAAVPGWDHGRPDAALRAACHGEEQGVQARLFEVALKALRQPGQAQQAWSGGWRELQRALPASQVDAPQAAQVGVLADHHAQSTARVAAHLYAAKQAASSVNGAIDELGCYGEAAAIRRERNGRRNVAWPVACGRLRMEAPLLLLARPAHLAKCLIRHSDEAMAASRKQGWVEGGDQRRRRPSASSRDPTWRSQNLCTICLW